MSKTTEFLGVWVVTFHDCIQSCNKLRIHGFVHRAADHIVFQSFRGSEVYAFFRLRVDDYIVAGSWELQVQNSGAIMRLWGLVEMSAAGQGVCDMTGQWVSYGIRGDQPRVISGQCDIQTLHGRSFNHLSQSLKFFAVSQVHLEKERPRLV
ncbi:MAG: hypothetical protein ACREGD_03840 [Candidatus Saccharimonadales bacterium]